MRIITIIYIYFSFDYITKRNTLTQLNVTNYPQKSTFCRNMEIHNRVGYLYSNEIDGKFVSFQCDARPAFVARQLKVKVIGERRAFLNFLFLKADRKQGNFSDHKTLQKSCTASSRLIRLKQRRIF